MRSTATVFILILVLLPLAAVSGQGVLTSGQPTTGAISAESPVALHSFQGAAGDLVSLKVFGSAGGLQPMLSLLSPAGSALAAASAAIGEPLPAASLDYRLPQSGPYSVLLGGVNGSQGPYVLLFAVQPPPEASEPFAGGSLEITASASAGPQYMTVAPELLPAVLGAEAISPDFLYRLVVRRSDGPILAELSGVNPIAVPLPADDGGYEVAVYALLPETSGGVRFTLVSSDQANGSSPLPTSPPLNEPVSTPEVVPGGDCTVSPTSGQINVRSGPGTNFAIVGSLPGGQSLPATGVNGSWVYVTYLGQGAWVSQTVAQFSGDCASLPEVPASGAGLPPTVNATGTVISTLDVTVTPTSTLPPGVTPTATLSPSPTATLAPGVTPTATFTPSATTIQPSATPTSPQPTQTFTPSYTPTTPPPPPTAPPDANFNSPLNIPLDTTASVTDFVSYPSGDTTDRVRWDITGMNQSAALPGGRARLIVAVSCFGTGTANVEFFVGGQTYACGQAIVDQEVTYDSRTGQVTITAVGGNNTYVQWVLTGTATRVN